MIAYCLVCIRVQDAPGPRCILPGFIRLSNARTRCRAHGQSMGLVSMRSPRNPLRPRPHHPASRPSAPCPPPMGEPAGRSRAHASDCRMHTVAQRSSYVTDAANKNKHHSACTYVIVWISGLLVASLSNLHDNDSTTINY